MLCLRIFQRIRSAWYDGVEEKDEETEDESENGDQPEITEPEEAVEEVEEGWLGSMVSTLQPSVSILWAISDGMSFTEALGMSWSGAGREPSDWLQWQLCAYETVEFPWSLCWKPEKYLSSQAAAFSDWFGQTCCTRRGWWGPGWRALPLQACLIPRSFRIWFEVNGMLYVARTFVACLTCVDFSETSHTKAKGKIFNNPETRTRPCKSRGWIFSCYRGREHLAQLAVSR